MMIPIFDSLTHPTLSGNWFVQNGVASFQKLLEISQGSDVEGFCAIGFADMEGHDHALFVKMVSASKKSVAIAGINPYKTLDITHELTYIKSLGYKAIKLHPRMGGYILNAEDLVLARCFEAASQLGLIIFLCTYTSSELNIYPDKDPYWELVKLLKKFPKTRCILLHGGVTRLLQYSELVRFNRNLLLDLSYTIIKFKNSSIDLDIQYLFNNLDQCICIGTDYPEYTMADLRNRLQDFEPYTSKEKLCNIYYKNLQLFLGVKP